VAAAGDAPSKRWSLRGLTDEGDEAWLIRGVSRKLYHCPGCHGDIEIGSEHTVVQFVGRLGGTEHHHWHQRCAEELLIPELRQVKRVPAKESSQAKLERRGRVPSGRRRRR
jgi:cytochrome c1